MSPSRAPRRSPPAIRVGISGWRYPGWRGDFYPESLPQRAEMAYACSRFPTVELNGTFYSLQRAAYFEKWREDTGDDFVFAIKGSRFITHMLQLNEPRQALANFFAQGILALGARLGPILWQFSSRFRFREEKLRPFLALLPHDQAHAARLAREHDHRVKDPAVALQSERLAGTRVRHALEVRHESFITPAFLDLLREHDAAAVVSDNPGLYPVIDEPTTDFMYLRLHGAEAMYAGSYTDSALDQWASRIAGWHAPRPTEAPENDDDAEHHGVEPARHDVFAYFDNDQKTRAPFDARRLMERLHLEASFFAPGTEDGMPF